MTKNKAIKLAIESIEYRRKKLYAVGHNMYLEGLSVPFTDKDHSHYKQLADAIDILEGLIK